MAPVVPLGEPAQLPSGDTWTWDIAPMEYPYSEGWTISYAIAGRTALAWNSSYVAQNGEGYRITIPTTVTDDLTAGVYRWTCYATKSGARYTVASGNVEVLRNLAVDTTSTAQLHAEKMVDLYEAALLLRTSPTSTTGGENLIEKYGVAAREVEKMSTLDMQKALGQWQARVAQFRNPTGFGTTIRQAFVRA